MDLRATEELIDRFGPASEAGTPLVLGLVPTLKEQPDWDWSRTPLRVGECIQSPLDANELRYRLKQLLAAPGFMAASTKHRDHILFGGLGDECVLSDPDSGRILAVNGIFLQHCGRTEQQWQSESIDSIGLCLEKKKHVEQARLLRSEGMVEFRCRRKLHGRRPYQVAVKRCTGLYRGKPAIISVIRDVSREGALERWMKVLVSSYQKVGERASSADLVDRIGQVLGLDYLVIASSDGSKEQSLTVNAAYCRTEEVRELIDLKEAAAYSRLFAGEEVVASEAAQEILQGFGFLATQHVASFVGLPLVGTNGEVIGLMIAAGKRRLQDAELAVDFLRTAAGHFSKLREIQRFRIRSKNLGLRDALTRLPNRILFLDRISQAIRSARRSGEIFAVLFVDLDRFKNINDSLGHAVGDEVLIAVAERLVGSVRAGDTVARHSGDEFTIVLRHIVQKEDVLKIAREIKAVLDVPLQVAGSQEHELYTTASVGISFYPEDGDSPEVLIKHADTAMYNAKNLGRNNYQLYIDTNEESDHQKLMLESKLRKAEANGELRIFFQPKVSAETEDIVGMEALMRWQHPELGLISPGFFIPLAEETGLILDIGSWLLRRACQRTRDWQIRFGLNLRVGVNLSPVQLRQADLVEVVDRALTDAELHPDCLDLEITESISIKSIVGLEDKLGALRDLGCSVSIDDFGTGQASLDYLKRFPADCIKIDQSFVRHIGVDRDDEAIIRATISMAHQLEMTVTAEGVEEEHHVTFLRRLGCELLQGFLFCRPQSEEGFARMLLEREALSGSDAGGLISR